VIHVKTLVVSGVLMDNARTHKTLVVVLSNTLAHPTAKAIQIVDRAMQYQAVDGVKVPIPV